MPFSVAKPATPIVDTRSGSPLLVGCCTVQVTDLAKIYFRDLKFTDVSKYFAMGHVSLVVYCPDRSDIQPLLLEGIKIKARKRLPAKNC